MDKSTLDNTFNLCMQQHYNEIFHYIRKQTLNTEDAKDLTQDVFMKEYTHLSRFDKQKASLRTWIYRIAHHHVMNHFRKASTRYESHFDPAFITTLKGSEDVLESLIQDENVALIHHVMMKVLNKKHLKIVHLHFFSE